MDSRKTSTYRPIADRDVFDIENSFYLRSEPYRLAKLLGQYEIYREIVSLPGDIVECGTFKGVSLIRFATFRYAMETELGRKIVAFDAFGSFPEDRLDRSDDAAFAATHDAGAGGAGIADNDLALALQAKGFRNIELVKGNVLDTIPRYFQTNNHMRIALLHLDMDVHAPTAFALEHLFDRVVPGGVIMIDDYGTVSGATDAVDDFMARRDLKIGRAPYYRIPAVIRKP